MESKKYVAYYRTSKDSHEAGRSKSKGLGLEAQKQIVEHYYKDLIVKEFTETKSAKNISQRPILQQAIRYCIDNNCWLVVAKLDRLSRDTIDVLSIVKILEKKVSFCDIPSEGGADEFIITIFAAIGQRERELISIRTSQALQVKLKREGSWHRKSHKWNLHQDTFVKSGLFSKSGTTAKKLKAASNENSIRASQIILSNMKAGLSLKQITDILNNNKFLSPNGFSFRPTQVRRIYKRATSTIMS